MMVWADLFFAAMLAVQHKILKIIYNELNGKRFDQELT